MNSHMNNAVYYQFGDSIVNTYLAEHCGCSATSHSSDPDEPIGLVASSYCNYYGPLQFPEPVTLGLRIVRLGRSSAETEVGFFAGNKDELSKDEEVKAVGGYTHVFVSREDWKPIRLKEMGGMLRDGLEAIYAGNSKSPELVQAKL